MPMIRRLISHARLGSDRQSGAATLPFAILMPVLLAMIYLIIQVALYSFARSVALTAAQEGAEAQRALGAQAGIGKQTAQSVVDRQGDSLHDVTIAVTNNGNRVQVTVTGRSVSLLPGFAGYSVRQTAGGPVEQFSQ